MPNLHAAALAALELKRRKELLLDDEFPEQAAFIRNTAPFLSAQCTRRAGKSTGLGFKLYNAAKRFPNAIVPYVGLTRESCENIMWPVFSELKAKYNLDYSMTISDLEVTLPNNSKIKLFGADQKGFIEKLRGPKYPMAAIDEAQAFKSHIESLVDDVFTPAVADYGGQIVLTGTPGPVPKGYFYETTLGKQGFEAMKWTVYDNPYFPDPHGFVERLFKKKEWTRETPSYRREWLGEWVADLDALVYKFNAEKNFGQIPRLDNSFHYLIGVDLGFWPDPSAFVVAAYSTYDKHLYILRCETHFKMDVHDVANRIKELQKEFRNARVIMDLGAQGKMIGEEIRRRHQIPVIAAEKTKKEGFIELFNSDLMKGLIKLDEAETQDLVDEWMNLIWDAEKERRVEDSRYPNHCADAALYIHRYCYNYAWETRPKKPARGSEEEMDEFWEREAQRLEAEKAEQRRLEAEENLVG